MIRSLAILDYAVNFNKVLILLVISFPDKLQYLYGLL